MTFDFYRDTYEESVSYTKMYPHSKTEEIEDMILFLAYESPSRGPLTS